MFLFFYLNVIVLYKMAFEQSQRITIILTACVEMFVVSTFLLDGDAGLLLLCFSNDTNV